MNSFALQVTIVLQVLLQRLPVPDLTGIRMSTVPPHASCVLLAISATTSLAQSAHHSQKVTTITVQEAVSALAKSLVLPALTTS